MLSDECYLQKNRFKLFITLCTSISSNLPLSGGCYTKHAITFSHESLYMLSTFLYS